MVKGKKKDRIIRILFVLMISALILMASCKPKEQGPPAKVITLGLVDNGSDEQGEPSESGGIVITLGNQSGEGHVITLKVENKTNETNTTNTINTTNTTVETNETLENIENTRSSAVEFYFLLKGKSYFQSFLKEYQVKTYNMSGQLITIESIIITEDSAKFRIDNFTTKSLGEKDSDATPEFEIIVKDIYYRR